MRFTCAAIPEGCLPRAPEPRGHELEVAARRICDVLASDRGRTDGDGRIVNLHDASKGFPTWGKENTANVNAFRWAVKLLADAGLVEVQVVEQEQHSEDKTEWFVRGDEPLLPPVYVLRSTPALWERWSAGAILDSGARTDTPASVPSSGTVPVDGPADPFLFRWRGRTVDLARASLRYRLLCALWDDAAGRPVSSCTVADLIEAVYPGEEEAEAKLKDLCSQINKCLEAAALGLVVRQAGGRVWLAIIPDAPGTHPSSV